MKDRNIQEIVPLKMDWTELTVGELRTALEGLDPNMPVRTGYYTIHGVHLEERDGFRYIDLPNSE